MDQPKTALISGSATGLGRRIALDLAEAGHRIIVNYKSSQEQAKSLINMLREQGTDAISLQADVSRPQACEALANKAFEEFGHIDIFIHCAGPYLFARKPMTDYTLEEWHTMIDGNLSSAFYLSRALVPSMRKRGWGRLIFFGFDRADTAPGWRYRSAYGAAKVGLVSLMKTLSLEEIEHGITSNMICPGIIRGVNKERKIEEVLPLDPPMTQIGRPGAGEDISRVVRFLCSEKSAMITGSLFQVTGGYDVLGRASTGEY